MRGPGSLIRRIGAAFPPGIWPTKTLARGAGATGAANGALFADAGIVFGLFLLAGALGRWGITGGTRIALRGGLLFAAAWLSFAFLLRLADRRLPQIDT